VPWPGLFLAAAKESDVAERDQNLLHHPFWAATNPENCRLVRISEPFPDAFNPFAGDGVVIRAGGVPGEMEHSKTYLGREGILDGVKSGAIQNDTIVHEATSGNTGHSMAKAANALGIRFCPHIPGDTPQEKINAMRVFGRYVSPELHFDPQESTVEKARRLGAQPGHYNPDQYAGQWNPDAHKRYLAPQLWQQAPNMSLLFVPAGSMGTGTGLAAYARERGLATKIISVMVERGAEVPGARNRQRIDRDVRLDWQSFFDETDIEYGPRHESFFLSFLSWQFVPQSLGPSFGLGLYGAFAHLWKHKKAGTLDRYRNAEGHIEAVVFGPDDSRLYSQLYLAELSLEELSARNLPHIEDIMSGEKRR
jgi:pyridoxal-phosphate dependent enzyme